jgi:hypothetical protein
MSGRHGRSTSGGQDYPQAAIEAEATATVIAIGGLRYRLRRQETLEHPKVLSELHKLQEQVTEQLAYADRNTGRHRSTVGKAISQQISDATGFDLKPNPLTATTPAEFIEALRQYKAWSGEPSWRRMATQAGQVVVHSTMYTAMNGDALPKLEVVKAIIIGCGGGEDDLSSFASAWRRITSGRTQSPAPTASFSLAPQAQRDRLRHCAVPLAEAAVRLPAAFHNDFVQLVMELPQPRARADRLAVRFRDAGLPVTELVHPDNHVRVPVGREQQCA